ncbi:MAG: hypothetical protein ACFFAN_13260 [Promethearchaeota archaeon]
MSAMFYAWSGRSRVPYRVFCLFLICDTSARPLPIIGVRHPWG